MNILFNEMAPSLETKLICNLLEKVLILWRKRKKLIAEIASNNNNINTPLVGSLAKAWTDTRTPDLTKKVPNRLKRKVIIDKKSVQFCKDFFFVDMIIVWSKAEDVNQGSKEAFSTGSQNQKPPHPNS